MTCVTKLELDNKLLTQMQKEVESLYKDCKPLHHLPSARQELCNPRDKEQSSIFVIDYQDFMKKDAKAPQGIFHHRHILVLRTPQKEEPFSLGSLSKLGRLDRVIEMQGK